RLGEVEHSPVVGEVAARGEVEDAEGVVAEAFVDEVAGAEGEDADPYRGLALERTGHGRREQQGAGAQQQPRRAAEARASVSCHPCGLTTHLSSLISFASSAAL